MSLALAVGCTGTGSEGDDTTVRDGGPSRSVVALAAGEQHSLLVTAAGEVYAAGNNSDGQLGFPETTGALEAYTVVPDLVGAQDVEAGSATSFVKFDDGRFEAFGFAGNGRLGIGTVATPRQYGAAAMQGPALSVVRSGGGHSLGIDASGAAFGWGFNTSGELGIGSTMDQAVPTAVMVLSNVASFDAAAGGGHSAAVTDDGTVYTWGGNQSGQLGDAMVTPNVLTPSVLASVDAATAVAVGGTHTLVLKDDGTVWAWGTNGQGQLGRGMTSQVETPAAVPGLSNVMAIDAGRDFSIALASDGTVWTWGNNAQGQLGLGTSAGANQLSPTQVPGLSDVTRIVAGTAFALALKSDGTVWGWGLTDIAQFGNGIYDFQSDPIRVF
ncbi:MAG: hypothetical protein RMA76_08685 [Deltaproteobacteria bacterium]